jgi:hypothetical protein
MNKKKDYDHFPIRETVMISGNIIERSKVTAKTEFRKDLVQLLMTNGYIVRFVPDSKIISRSTD